MKTEQFLQKCMNTILHSNINLFEETMKPNSQIKPFCRYTDFLFKISTIPLKAFCRIGFIEMLIRYCYSIVLNELCQVVNTNVAIRYTTVAL